MDKTLATVNKLLIEVFNDILTIEENALKNGAFKDISVTEVHTIEAIGMYIPKTMSDVARKLNITVGTLTVAINNLVKKGYVKRKRSEIDRRVVKISLTNKGRLIYRVHEKFHSDMIKAIIVGLSEQETQVFNKALINISDFLIEKYKTIKQGEAYV